MLSFELFVFEGSGLHRILSLRSIFPSLALRFEEIFVARIKLEAVFWNCEEIGVKL